MNSIPSSVCFPKIEEEILAFWKEGSVFEKSLDKNRGRDSYIFYDGPPFATGLPHYGHILTSYIKDTIPRYHTMKGKFVDRRWGWDCHGLPIENEIEQKLDIYGKAAIESFGIDKFNQACKDIVLKYADDWCGIIDRIGRWVDFDRKYQTMDLDYMESVMWVFKTLHRKGLIYESLKVVAYCNRCETPLSNFETGLDDSYRIKDDPAVTVTFAAENEPDEFFLAWTTTPWTLPANLALAVHPDIEYCRVASNSRARLILARDRLDFYKNQLSDYQVVNTFKGKDLIGKEYCPLFPFAETRAAFRIIEANFVDTQTGTGIVHIAPAFGDDDFLVCQKEGIESFDPVGLDGKFTCQAGFLEGLDVFEANIPIIAYLKEKGLLFARENYRHNYPHCWRCDSPLIYRAINSWYVNVNKFKDKMIRANQNINWVPGHIKTGRFGQWLEGARDWAISRNRFWGSPISVWKCDQCHNQYIPESIKDLEEKSGRAITDLHRPACDRVVFPCDRKSCKGRFKRVPEVLDCWFESGAMPYAQVHFPFENKNSFEETFPASFIVEYVAQTRGWFYTLMVESASVMGKHPFQNAICHGVILAEDGRKMSKRLKNFPDPIHLINEYGSDALRIYLLSSPVVKGTDIRFNENSVKDAVRRYLIPLWNSFHFFTSYSNLVAGYSPRTLLAAENTEDRHILSELECFKIQVQGSIEGYDLPRCYANILGFVETLSGWYIRNNRQRFWATDLNDDAECAFNTLYTVLMDLSRICAPFIPFTMEYIYLQLTGKSVHLSDWPREVPQRVDSELNNDVQKIRAVIEGGRRIREKNRVNLRQPLSHIRVVGIPSKTLEKFAGLLKNQLNVKKVLHEAGTESFCRRKIRLNSKKLGPKLKKDYKKVLALIKDEIFESDSEGSLVVDRYRIEPTEYSVDYLPLFSDEDIWFDRNLVVSVCLTVTENLKIEGTARNLNRYVQDLRKKLNLPYDARISLGIEASGMYLKSVTHHKEWLMEQSLAVDLKNKVDEVMFEKKDNDGSLKINIQRSAV